MREANGGGKERKRQRELKKSYSSLRVLCQNRVRVNYNYMQQKMLH